MLTLPALALQHITRKDIHMSKIKIYEAGEQLNRIANALEEVLRLVKQDQEDAKKRMLAAADEGLKEHEKTHD